MDMKELLEKLCGIYGPSGQEELVAEALKELLKDSVDEFQQDGLGSLIAIRHGAGPKVMLSAHMDQIGLMVTFIEDNGFLRACPVGGFRQNHGIPLRFKSGLIACLAREDKEPVTAGLDKFYLDVGAKNREEAEKLVSVGDVAVYAHHFAQSGNAYISGALDDRVACAIQAKALMELESTENDIYAVFSAQEEVGTRGAATAAFKIDPDVGLAIDVTGAGDTPNAAKMAMKLGYGPTVKIKDNSVMCHPKVRDWMADTAKENGIPFQYEVLPYGGTDSGAIALSRGGVPSGVLSIPMRYLHTPVEMAYCEDVDNAVKFLSALIKTKAPF
jgi:endoglucanase